MCCLCVCVCVFTSCAFPKCPEAFLFEDLPKAVDDSAVCGLARSGCYLEPGLDDISRGDQRGRGHALGDVPEWTKPRTFILHRLTPAELQPGRACVCVCVRVCRDVTKAGEETMTRAQNFPVVCYLQSLQRRVAAKVPASRLHPLFSPCCGHKQGSRWRRRGCHAGSKLWLPDRGKKGAI